MNPRPLIFAAFLSIVAGVGCVSAPRAQSTVQAPAQDHVAWVSDSLKRMKTVKPGMTRADLLKVFTTEGGLSNRTRRTYVSRDCPYFKVDVEFRAAGPGHEETADDVISTVSRPYLAFMTLD